MIDNTAGAPDPPAILRLEADPRNADRVVVTVGQPGAGFAGAQTLLLHLAVVVEEGLYAGQPCPPERLARLDAANTFQQHYVRALNFLAVRPRSEAEVRRRLRAKGTPAALIDPIVARLERARYLDDAEFARYWLGERARCHPRGARLLRAELRQKGVATATIEEALAAFEAHSAAEAEQTAPPAPADNGGELPDADDESRETREARVQAERKLRSYRGLPAPTVRRRLGAYLLRRGYDYATVAVVLKSVLTDD